MASTIRVTCGIAIWIGLLGVAWNSWGDTLFRSQQNRPPIAETLTEYATQPRQQFSAVLPREKFLAIGDPVFVETSPGVFEFVGEIRRLTPTDPDDTGARKAWSEACELTLFGNAPDWAQQAKLEFHGTPDDMAWVLETMVPPEKRAEISRLISDAMIKHQSAITAELQPVIIDALRDALVILEKELRVAFAEHRGEIQKISKRYEKQLVEKEIVPLVKKEIWPVVLEHGEPVAKDIGLEIWARVPKWRFTWRFVADTLPLTRDDRFEEEFNRFVADEAIPELNEHTDELIDTVKLIMTDAISNNRVQEAIRNNLFRVIEDRELQKLIWEIVQDVVQDSTALRDVMKKHWYSQRTQDAIRSIASRLDPTAQNIGEMLLGSPRDGITDEFNEVLRNRILFKDRRWFVLRRMDDDRSELKRDDNGLVVLPVEISNEYQPSPFVTPESDDD